MGLADVPRLLWTKSPRDIWQRLSGRKPAGDPVWASGKHRQWNRLPYYLQAFRVAAGHFGHTLDVAGRRVLEFGPGPALGFAPFLLVEGATAITLVDPGYEEVRDETRFQRSYLLPVYRSYSRLMGRAGPGDFDAFLAAVRQIEINKCRAEELQLPADQFGVVLSKSTMEYFTDIDRFVDICYDSSTAGSLHCHYLDLTMHRPEARAKSPFGDAYQRSRASNPEFYQNPGGDLNLLRLSDLTVAFQRRFKEVHFYALEEYPERVPAQLHADWAKYPAAELGIANGILLAVK